MQSINSLNPVLQQQFEKRVGQTRRVQAGLASVAMLVSLGAATAATKGEDILNKTFMADIGLAGVAFGNRSLLTRYGSRQIKTYAKDRSVEINPRSYEDNFLDKLVFSNLTSIAGANGFLIPGAIEGLPVGDLPSSVILAGTGIGAAIIASMANNNLTQLEKEHGAKLRQIDFSYSQLQSAQDNYGD